MPNREQETRGGNEADDQEVVLRPSQLAREEIVPVPRAHRSLRWLSFAAIWFTMTAQMGVFALGASLAEGMPVWQALLAVLIANLGMIVVLALIGDIGIEHGINFAGYLRVPFGLRGSYLPLALRGLSAIAWFGIQTYLGATAIEVVSSEFFGVSALPVWYVGFGIIQIVVVAGGIETIKKVVNLAAPALAVLSAWLLYEMFSTASVGEFFDHPVRDPHQPFVVAVVANLSYWATVAINLPDFTRNVEAPPEKAFLSRNRHSVIAQLIGVPLGMLFFTTVGMAGFVFTGESNPVLAIAELMGGSFLLLALAVVVLAQLSTNITANLYASAYAANAIGPPKISYRWGAVITGALGLMTFPWLLLDLFLTYLPAVGAALAPIAGIMIADYYLIRKRRIDVPQLFDPEGQYRYWHGINPASFLAWIAGAIAGVAWLDYSFLIALPIGFVLYYVLMQYWIAPDFGQTEMREPARDLLASSIDRDWPVRMETADGEE
jgi:NCS1 family nucleobase:cation symporter-1